jgi:hypothetical protein
LDFESTFLDRYGVSSAEYFGLGPDGIVGRWATDDELKELDCIYYEACQFVILATVSDCPRDVALSFQILNDIDEVLDSGESSAGPLFVGRFQAVEIGFNSDDDLFLVPLEASCLASLPTV